MVSQHRRLGVWTNGIHIGMLTQSAPGALEFAYTPEWLATDGARPISLSMPLQHRAYAGEIV